MGLFEKMEAAIQAGDVAAVASLYHVDFEMKMHSSGAVMTKENGKKGLLLFLITAISKEEPHAASTRMTTCISLIRNISQWL